MQSTKPWWERFPGRLEYELTLLQQDGVSFRINDALKVRGVLRLDVVVEVNGEQFELPVLFPSLYPYFRPEVFAKLGRFHKHQNPFGGNLCLLSRRTYHWHPQMTLAELLRLQFPQLLKSVASDIDVSQNIEEPQGEPVTSYFVYDGQSSILFDPSTRIDPAISKGRLELLVDTRSLPRLYGTIASVAAASGKKLAATSTRLIPPHARRLWVPWVRLPSVPTVNTPRELENQLLAQGLIPRATYAFKSGNWAVDLVGLLMTEEIGYHLHGDAWLFLARLKNDARRETGTVLVRAGRVAAADFAARIPSLTFLHGKRVLVVGVGAVGAPCAIELARSGVSALSLFDSDFVETGSVVRWPLGLASSGKMKTAALAEFLQENYPMTSVDRFDLRLGQVPELNVDDEIAVIEKAVSGADLVLDCTAEDGVHQFLDDYTRARGLPYVIAYATPGGVGGLVARMGPTTGCWLCLQRALYEQKTIQEPPFIDDGSPQPPGCAERTFTGTSFDLCEVSLQATRAVVACLKDRAAKAAQDWDVAVLSMLSATGTRIPPQWNIYSLPPTPGCACNK
jgi:hypothetical protein